MTVPESSAYVIPSSLKSTYAAPLLCAGAVGYRALMLSGMQNGGSIGLTGFGGSNHIVLQIIRFMYPASKIFVFARSENERAFAKELGAYWTGDTTDVVPDGLNCIIDTTPVWKPVMEALKNLKPGGRLVINAIRKEENDKELLLKLDYSKHLWMEKEIKSVANVTGKDITDFLKLAAEIPVIPEIQEYKLEEANVALAELKMSKIRGAKVLVISKSPEHHGV
jgi:propanol-preferring alcohol dehydrogenase